MALSGTERSPAGLAGSSSSATAPADGGYRYAVIAVLAFTYMFNFIDRQLLSILAEPVKQDLGLSDTQLGMLTGLMFAIFYTLFGIPVAVLADRWNRTRVVAIACGLWSLFTAASGLATSFLTLALARIGVGVGEAGCSPPSYSIISDYFPPKERGRALALYVLGVPAGSFVGTLAGGWIAAEYGWRMAFFVVGAAGLVLAPLIPLLVREPPRGRYDANAKAAVAGAARPPVSEAFRFFLGSPPLVLSAIASGLTGLVSYGIINWAPAFLTRVQGMTLSQIGVYFGVSIALSMVAGAWLGALFSDRFGVRRPLFYPLLPGVGLLLIIPFIFGFTSADNWQMSLGLLIVPMILTSTYLVPALALLQNRTPPEHRATTSSILLFVINLCGLGCGPLIVGAISDWLQPQYGVQSLAYALQWLTPFIVLAFLFQAAAAWTMRNERNDAD